MISEQEILQEIKDIRKKTSLLANPLFNDSGGSSLWNDIDKKLENIENKLKSIKLYG